MSRISAGFVKEPCVSGPIQRASFVMFDRVTKAFLSADSPSLDLTTDARRRNAPGRRRVSFFGTSGASATRMPVAGARRTSAESRRTPNRYGLPAFYEMHDGLEQNPVGSFADWNTHVTANSSQVTRPQKLHTRSTP